MQSKTKNLYAEQSYWIAFIAVTMDQYSLRVKDQQQQNIWRIRMQPDWFLCNNIGFSSVVSMWFASIQTEQ